MKTISYPVRFSEEEYEALKREAAKRRKTIAGLFRELIVHGMPALPPIPESYEATQEVWDSLGPAPEILYDKLPKDW